MGKVRLLPTICYSEKKRAGAVRPRPSRVLLAGEGARGFLGNSMPVPLENYLKTQSVELLVKFTPTSCYCALMYIHMLYVHMQCVLIRFPVYHPLLGDCAGKRP